MDAKDIKSITNYALAKIENCFASGWKYIDKDRKMEISTSSTSTTTYTTWTYQPNDEYKPGCLRQNLLDQLNQLIKSEEKINNFGLFNKRITNNKTAYINLLKRILFIVNLQFDDNTILNFMTKWNHTPNENSWERMQTLGRGFFENICHNFLS